MNDAASPLLFVRLVAELAAHGVRLTARPGEYCVNFRNGSEATAYVTDDLTDAIEHGRTLARAARQSADTVPARPACAKRRRRPPAMTPKARRHRMIRRHNQRLCARMLRQQREELPR